MTRRTTIKDVAARAGVSYQTVSRVLNEKPDVAHETRQRVLTAMRDLDYQPSLAARALPQGRTYIIGVVISYDPQYLFSDPHLLSILHGADEIATQNDCAILLSTSHSYASPISAYQRLLGHQYYVDGVIVDGSLGEEGHRLLRGRGYRLVVAGYSKESHCVHSDDQGGARLMTEHLLSLGHRRVGVIAGPQSDRWVTEARLTGYQAALERMNIAYDPNLVTHGTFRTQSGYQGAAHLMALPDPPTAIFAFNDRMAIGAIRYLRETGHHVPKDVSVAGFDDIGSAELFDPPLTTIRQQSLAQGRLAASLLLDLVNGAPIGERQEIVLPAELIIRQSTATRHVLKEG